MSLGGEHQRVLTELRAKAHPLRLRMLSLLTGAALSAAELARELQVSQALASYHLRQLADAGLVELTEERSHRGGRERRYRYRVESLVDQPAAGPPAEDDAARGLFVEAVVAELRRRASMRTDEPRGLSVDAELWVDPQDWEQACRTIAAASIALHEQARRPHEPGTVHVNTSVVMFAMRDEQSPSLPGHS